MATKAPRGARPYAVRGIVAAVLGIAAIVIGREFGQLFADNVTAREAVVGALSLVVLVVAGVVAVHSMSRAVKHLMDEHAGERHVVPVSLILSFLGYLALGVGVLVLLRQPVGGILLGGALTGVLIGIAAQQVLANFFAGLVLLLVRPFTIADEIVLKSGPLGGEYEGLVTDMGLFYVKLQTHTGPVALPNAGVLAAAVGPGVRAAQEREEEEEEEQPADASSGPPA